MERWVNLGGSFIAGPCALTVDQRRLAVFGVGTEHSMQVRWRNSGEWGDWQSLGGALIAEPTAISRSSGSIDAFCVSHDQSVCHRRWDGVWEPWHALHGVVGGLGSARTPTVTADDSGLSIFRLAPDMSVVRKVYHSEERSDWETLGEDLLFPPSAVTADTGLHLMSVGFDSHLRHAIVARGAEHHWEVLSDGRVASAPSLIRGSNGSVEVYYVGSDRSMYRRIWRGSWGDPQSLEGTILERPTVVTGSGGRIDVFIVGEDRALWQRCRTADGWTWWQSLGGQAYSAISAVQQSDRVELFVRGRDSAVWHRIISRHD
jgi:hypothetical protein